MSFVDFPSNRDEALNMPEDLSPTNVIEIVPAMQIPYKSRYQLLQEKKTYLEENQQVKGFYKERSVVCF